MAMRRFALALGVALALALAACGGDKLSLSEYTEQIHEIAGTASERGAALIEDAEAVTDFTPEIAQAGVQRGLVEVRIPLQESVDSLVPPESIADLHEVMWTWHAELISIEEAVADRFGATPDTEEGWTELSNSPEMAAYRASLAEGKQLCVDFQAALDERAEGGMFSETPWVPDELGTAVRAALGCEFFPDDPDSIWRYP